MIALYVLLRSATRSVDTTFDASLAQVVADGQSKLASVPSGGAAAAPAAGGAAAAGGAPPKEEKKEEVEEEEEVR